MCKRNFNLLFIILFSCQAKHFQSEKIGKNSQTILNNTFEDFARVNSIPCSDDFSVIDNCYNEELPPTPSIMRSMYIPESSTLTKLKFFNDKNMRKSQNHNVPHFKTTFDGRLGFSEGSYKSFYDAPTILKFSPENLDRGYKLSQKDTLRRVSSQMAFIHYPWLLINPLEGQSRIPQEILFQTNSKQRNFNLDLCSRKEGIGNPLTCNAIKDGETISGECYFQTLLTSHRPKVNQKEVFELRSLDLIFFVPHGKTAPSPQNNIYRENILIYPMSVFSPFRGLPEYNNFIYEDIVGCKYDYDNDGIIDQFDCNEDFSTLATAAKNDCLNDNPEPWCAFINDQKFLPLNENYNMPNGEWNGENNYSRKHALLEPATTGDGKLLFIHDHEDLVYSYQDTPHGCDASKFKNFKPLTEAFYDTEVNQKYDFAKYLIRDTDGRTLERGEKTFGGYPWVDRKGKNIIFTRLQGQSAYHLIAEENIGEITVPDTKDEYNIQSGDSIPFQLTNTGNLSGATIVGSWTKGKLIDLDNGLNLSDFRTPIYKLIKKKLKISLFQEDQTLFSLRAPTQINSLENQLNQYDSLAPISPFDVVWMVGSNNGRLSELIFDDYLNENALVIAHMNAPHTSRSIDGKKFYFYDNGFTPDSNYTDTELMSFTGNPKLQNAATVNNSAKISLRGGAFIPPFSLGGVLGKGVFLDGKNDFIEIQNIEAVNNFSLSMWIEKKSVEEEIIFNIGSHYFVTLSDNNISITDNQKRKSVNIPNNIGRYFHISINNYYSKGQSDLFINGNFLTSINIATKLENNTLYIGKGPEINIEIKGVKGWVDEFKLYKLDLQKRLNSFQREYQCNLALGSLAKTTDFQLQSNSDFKEYNKPHYFCEQLDIHSERETKLTFPQTNILPRETYVDSGLSYPEQAYTSENCGNSVHRDFKGFNFLESFKKHECYRESALQITPLRLNQPRPSFTNNTFCLSCHKENHPIEGLKLIPLLPGQENFEHDHKPRQPMMWPKYLFGDHPKYNNSYIFENLPRTQPVNQDLQFIPNEKYRFED